jgi:hypothetical protein
MVIDLFIYALSTAFIAYRRDPRWYELWIGRNSSGRYHSPVEGTNTVYRSVSLWLYSPLLDLGRFFSFLILYTVGRTHWTGVQPIARPLLTHRTTQTQNKRTQTSISWVGFEPTIPVCERAKTVHALDCTAIVMGYTVYLVGLKNKHISR